ncbi:MAG TPA: PIN domain nuclease [Actinocrinis sp.]|uniref:PIN domain nuclease n=1 Tax=Actinocrinis sp. TaxID=1920516 RepID=UPI002DDD014F|nr:PIN domain nuclease [Actinocrinis sp.]HEV2344002.1 PIN domain nuclease [Actinocrinis sp.]
MVLSRYLVDTSAAVRIMTATDLVENWIIEITAGQIAICAITELELRYSAKSVDHDRQLRRWLGETFVWAPIQDRCHERALEVQNGLVANGEQRSAGPIDLMLAANAELSGLTVLHDDRDFDCVARVTGQAVMRIGEL